MPIVLQAGYEDAVRSKLGVKAGELPDSEINQRLIVDLAENTLIKRVPNYTAITDTHEQLLFEGSIISYICYLLAPSMARRLNLKVSTVDVKWERGKVDWQAMAEMYAGEVELALLGISSVVVDSGGDSLLTDIVRQTRTPI